MQNICTWSQEARGLNPKIATAPQLAVLNHIDTQSPKGVGLLEAYLFWLDLQEQHIPFESTGDINNSNSILHQQNNKHQ